MILRVHYPANAGKMVLRCDSDWSIDMEPSAITENAECTEFNFTIHSTYSYFKPVWLIDDGELWSRGNNYLALAHAQQTRDIYPYFLDDFGCEVCEIDELANPYTQAKYAFRVFTPPGYLENTLKRYPVLYLQDGQNVFFPGDSFSGADWRIQETLTVLNAMNVIDKVLAVGIYPNDRVQDYTYPGYEAYGRFIAQTLKQRIDETFRTLPDHRNTAIMGASLGGVASLFTAWQWPDVFGMTACLSSTFGWRDDLAKRIATESPRNLKIYLDSGWPQDNYEATRNMHALLLSRGYQDGLNLLYFAFPGAHHDEKAWAVRSHVPFQYFFDRHNSQPEKFNK